MTSLSTSLAPSPPFPPLLLPSFPLPQLASLQGLGPSAQLNMGDLTSQTSASPTIANEDPKTMAELPSGPPPVVGRLVPGVEPVGQTEASLEAQAQAQPQPAGQQHPFASQLDMSRATHPQHAQHAQHGGSRPYNMAPMANALPQVQYRPGQYPVGHQQQRYNHPASPPMMPQMPYGPSAGAMNMNMGHQGYYVQQQPHMVQYYAGGQSPSQMQMPPRQGMAYYPQQMMMGQPQAGFYYPQPTQYSTPNQSMSPTPLPRQHQHQHHHSSNPTAKADSHSQSVAKQKAAGAPRNFDEGGKPARGQGQKIHHRHQRSKSSRLTRLADPGDKRPGAVRGPPRKPRQSGKKLQTSCNGEPSALIGLFSRIRYLGREPPASNGLDDSRSARV